MEPSTKRNKSGISNVTSTSTAPVSLRLKHFVDAVIVSLLAGSQRAFFVRHRDGRRWQAKQAREAERHGAVACRHLHDVKVRARPEDTLGRTADRSCDVAAGRRRNVRCGPS